MKLPAVEDGTERLRDHLVELRDCWLLNDTQGPVAELLGTRLLGLEIARNTVNQAQVRWHADGETVLYQDVQLEMQQLRQLVQHELDAARALFLDELCLGLEHVPEYELGRLGDN